MKLHNLLAFLLESGLRPEAVSCNGRPTAPEQYCIDKADNVWRVYYRERGKRNQLGEFAQEEDACDYLVKLLETDRSVWKESRSATT